MVPAIWVRGVANLGIDLTFAGFCFGTKWLLQGLNLCHCCVLYNIFVICISHAWPIMLFFVRRDLKMMSLATKMMMKRRMRMRMTVKSLIASFILASTSWLWQVQGKLMTIERLLTQRGPAFNHALSFVVVNFCTWTCMSLNHSWWLIQS